MASNHLDSNAARMASVRESLSSTLEKTRHSSRKSIRIIQQTKLSLFSSQLLPKLCLSHARAN